MKRHVIISYSFWYEKNSAEMIRRMFLPWEVCVHAAPHTVRLTVLVL